MILMNILLACSDKAEDTVIESPEGTDTASEESTEDSETNDSDENSNSDEENGTNGSGDSTVPNSGKWEVDGPEFTTNTCGGGESYPDPRPMQLSISGEALTLVIGASDDDPITHNCTLVDLTYRCDDVVIENILPTGGTLYYRHQLSGMFSESTLMTGDYIIVTTCEGSFGCGEEDLGFTVPCEQSGMLEAQFVE